MLYAAFRNHPRYKACWDKSLDEPFRKVGYLPLYELISLLYRGFGLFANFPEEAAFLARFLDAVTSLEAEGVASPRAFIAYASGADEDKAKVFSIALPEYIDAVRVMTFHKSKGLGFSVVINLLYEERAQSDPMYFEEKDGAIHVYHITKAAAEVSAKLRPVYEGRRADANVQDLNVLYVISTRARHELYNLVVKKARAAAKEAAAVCAPPGERQPAKTLELFEPFEAGRPEPRKPEGRELSRPVEITFAGARPEPRFDALKPTYNSFYETAEGELVHRMLSKLTLPAAKADLEKYYAELAPAFPFKFDEAKVVGGLAAFLASPAAAPLFDAAPGRQTLVEAEFIDRNGALFRMDRVLVDPGAVTVIDFKTGGVNSGKYEAQMKNYLAIIAEVYGRPAKGVLAYVDLVKVQEVTL